MLAPSGVSLAIPELRLLGGGLTILDHVCWWEEKGSHSPAVQILREGEATWSARSIWGAL